MGGQVPITERMALRGLGCGRGNDPFIDDGRLSFMAFSGMMSGLNGKIPVAAKAALMVSGVDAHKNARLNTPAKSLLVTLLKCKSSKAVVNIPIYSLSPLLFIVSITFLISF